MSSGIFQQRITAALGHGYRIERELGAGAMATVYLAWDLKHGRQVALKLLRPELALVVGTDRFLREIDTAAKLSHPGIVPLLDSGEIDGLPFYTMPLVQGESLRDRLRREGRLSVEEALRVANDVSRALAYAHSQGVVHRDIKPDNILLENETARIVDFGIALAIEESDAKRLTHAGVVIGTPAYMSPEQGAGSSKIDHRSDIYSLACVLYEMLAGEPPFDAPTVQATIVSQMVDPPPPLRKSRPVVPMAIEATVEQALAKDPANRFQSASAFADALLDPGRTLGLRPRMRRRFAGRTRRLAITGATTLLAIVTVGLIVTRVSLREGSPLGARDWVLVADFDGPSSDRTLPAAVRELVTAELNQSRFMATMPRQALAGPIRDAGLPDTVTVNVDLGRELAYRTAVRAVIGGRIDSTAAGYALTIRALGSETGRQLAIASDTVSTDSLVNVVQRLARQVRRELGERREDIEANQPLLDIATPSLPAFRLYVESVQRKVAGDVSGSTRLLRQAIALDTGFASAWMAIGMNYVEARDLDSARIAFDEALRRPDRLSRAQLYRLRAEAAYAVDHDLPATVRWYAEYLKQIPRSVGGRNNLGLYLSLLGRYEEALTQFEESEANDPFMKSMSQPAVINATDMLMALGKLDRARAKARELTGAYASYTQLRLLTTDGKWAAAETLAVKLLASPTTPPALRVEATTTRAEALMVRGAAAEADSLLAGAARDASAPQRRWYEQARSLIALTSGRPAPDDGALALPDDSPGALVARGIRLALRGDITRARAEKRRIDSLPGRDRARLRLGGMVVEALVDRAAGRWRHLVETLADTARVGEHDATDLDHVPSLTMRWLVADAYAHLGRTDSAVTFLRMAITLERIPPGHRALRGFAYPFATRLLATWSAQLGDEDAARREWQAFTKVFTTPDEGLRPLLTMPMLVARP